MKLQATKHTITSSENNDLCYIIIVTGFYSSLLGYVEYGIKIGMRSNLHMLNNE